MNNTELATSNEKQLTFPTVGVIHDRVVAEPSITFISELQHNQNGDNPVLTRVETSTGHGVGKPTSKGIGEYVSILSFIFNKMNEEMNFELKG